MTNNTDDAMEAVTEEVSDDDLFVAEPYVQS